MEEAKERYAQHLNRRYGDRSTPYHYLRDLEMFIQEIGSKPPKNVTAQDISQFVDSQLARGLAASTINRRSASLHTFFEYLASERPDEVWPNPVNRRLHSRRQPTYVPRDAKEDVVARLFASLDKARDRAIFGLMVGAGLRVGEVVDLRLSYLEAGEAGRKTTSLRVMGKGRKERMGLAHPLLDRNPGPVARRAT
jgi:site-specific recombinase XerD